MEDKETLELLVIALKNKGALMRMAIEELERRVAVDSEAVEEEGEGK